MANELKELKVVTSSGSEMGSKQVDVAGVVVEKSQRIVSEVCTMYLANQKKHTASVKGRSDVSCSKRKQRKQKGTGRARAGHASSPIWVGGGVAFGPRPRDVRYEIPKKIKRKALKEALLLKIINDEIVILEELKINDIKTKNVAEILKNIGLSKSVKFIVNGVDSNLILSCRNIPKVSALNVKDLNALDVVGAGKLVFTKAAFEEVEKILAA